MRDILSLSEWKSATAKRVVGQSWPAAVAIKDFTVRTARLMVGVPDYDNYVQHRQTNHPGQPVMTYQEFFVERQEARFAIGKGRFRGCC